MTVFSSLDTPAWSKSCTWVVTTAHVLTRPSKKRKENVWVCHEEGTIYQSMGFVTILRGLPYPLLQVCFLQISDPGKINVSKTENVPNSYYW